MESASSAFDAASRAVIDYLAEFLPLGMWTVTRYDGERQVYLSVAGAQPLHEVGDSIAWTDSFCQYSVTGAAPSVIADAMTDPVYSTTEPARSGQVATYVGLPIRSGDGTLFGTLCGVDSEVQHAVAGQSKLFALLTGLLGHVVDADLDRAAAARDAAVAETLAQTDPLTGLLNRRGWDRMVALYDERNRVVGDPCAVLAIDLDGLKQVNDADGHEAGDALLLQAAGLVRAAVRGGDVVARLGGDEFGVLAGLTPAEARALVGRLDALLHSRGIGASIGVADATSRGGCAAAWKAADADMYAAKAERKQTRQLSALG